MRRGYTLIEIIITVAITGILSVGMFKAFEAVTQQSEKAKILSTLSIDSQSALDQISSLLYHRVPLSVSGYDVGDPSRTPLALSVDKTVIEWIGTAQESYGALYYSGFADMNRSSRPDLYTPGTSKNGIETTQNAKWGSFDWNDTALVFSGSFDEGTPDYHPVSMGVDDTITFTDTPPDTIYEKYQLVDSAYAVTRGEHIDQSAPCIAALGLTPQTLDNTLLLFYGYRPWKGESFCADIPNGSGKVAILSAGVNAFRARMLNGTIRLSIDMNRTLRGSNPIRLSKQKVVF